jgi:hypothetical protein
MLFAGVVLSLIVVLVWPKLFPKLGEALALIFFPFVLLTFSQNLRLGLSHSAGGVHAASPPAAPLPSRPGARRVVWVVFDELDQALAFERRPASVSLPEFDRFRAQALQAGNAWSPARRTIISMPALITGRPVLSAAPISAGELGLRIAGETQLLPWSQQPNLFSAARSRGFNSAIAGSFIPYCKVLGGVLTSCTWSSLPEWTGDIGNMTFLDVQVSQLRSALAPTPWLRKIPAPRLQSLRQITHRKAYETHLGNARRAVADPSLHLILAHFPVPHPPAIYDRSREALSTNPGGSYLDNLELADRALKEVRLAMEAAHLWEASAVLVTSDHWWRTEQWNHEPLWTEDEAPFASKGDHRVPFLLKMPGQNSPLAYDAAINTILTHDLLLAVLQGELSRPEEVAQWIDRRRSRDFGSPADQSCLAAVSEAPFLPEANASDLCRFASPAPAAD